MVIKKDLVKAGVKEGTTLEVLVSTSEVIGMLPLRKIIRKHKVIGYVDKLERDYIYLIQQWNVLADCRLMTTSGTEIPYKLIDTYLIHKKSNLI